MEGNIYFILFCSLSPIILLGVFFAGFYHGKNKERKDRLNAVYPNGNPMEISFGEKYKINETLGHGKHFIQRYEMVTVLLADIEGFSKISDNIEPEVLMEELSSFFMYFDSIIDKYQIDKIKTMGDAYMCAGGILYKNHTNPIDVIMLALDVQNHRKKLAKTKENVWPMRIGVHTGPVIAGMLGEKKLAFDIWGHTVNVTARLETFCEPGRVNISGTTYEKVKQYFDCEYHGITPRTTEESYFVNGLKPEYLDININGEPEPNYAFFIQMQFLRLTDLEEYVLNMITNTVSNMFFHNINHIMDVYKEVELLAFLQNVNDEDILLMKTAALMHDIGFSIAYEANIHNLSEDIAREFLPPYKYEQKHIERIVQLMKATHYDHVPTDSHEEIMHDANHMYYGSEDYIEHIVNLYREQEIHNISIEKEEWFEKQTERLAKHKFYTNAARKLIKVPLEQQLINLKKQEQKQMNA